MFPCIESTLDIRLGDKYIVRLWIDREDIPENPEAFNDLVEQITEKVVAQVPHKEFLEWLTTLPDVNAVQLIERLNSLISRGTVVYTVDFGDDVHG